MLFKEIRKHMAAEDEPWWEDENFFNRVKKRGSLFDGPVVNTEGQPGMCQPEVRDALRGNNKLRVWIGWAMQYDQWFRHVAGFHPDTGTLHEVTTHCQKYFGIVLDEKDSETFCLEYEDI